MDQIKIENLEIFANHGVYPEENRLGQKFLVSCILTERYIFRSPHPGRHADTDNYPYRTSGSVPPSV